MTIADHRSDNHEAATAGRPKDMAKRDAIVGAARKLFFAKGYADVAIEHIAAAAGVSKVTVYGHFGSKLALFGAVVAAEAVQMRAKLETLPSTGSDIRSRLTAYGTVLLENLTRPDLIAFDRLVRSQSEQHPDIARAYIENGPRRTIAIIEAELRQAGLTRGASGRKAAEQLASLWFGIFYMEVQMGLRPTPTRAAIVEHVTACVALVLK